LFMAFASHHGYLQVLEDGLLQYRFWARGEIDSPVKVIYVDMDTKSIDELGNFPWPRSHFALVGSSLFNVGHAKAIGVDVVFSERGLSEAYDRPKWIADNVEFYRFLRKNPPMVVGATYAAREFREVTGQEQRREFPYIRDGLPPLDQIALPELPEFNVGGGLTRYPQRIGLIDTVDGGTRWVAMFAPTSVQRYDHLALNLALIYYDVSPDKVRITDTAIEIPDPHGGLHARIPLTDSQLVEVNWFSKWDSAKNSRESFSVVYNYARALNDPDEKIRRNAQKYFEQFADSIVLIGPVDPLLQDLAPTPVDSLPVPRVGVHGNLLKTIVSGKYLLRLPVWAMYLLTFGLTVVVTELAMKSGGSGLRPKMIAALLLVLFAWLSIELFQLYHIVLPMTAPLGGAFFSAFLGILWQLRLEEKQKGRIKGMFSAYLAPTVVNRLIDSGKEPELGGHEEVVTAYFSDIQKFSKFSELMPPAQLVELMNEYFTACTDLIQEERGTLDKYIGDAVVAMFGAPLPQPDHAFRACVTAVRVQQKIEDLREKWKKEGDRWPHIVHVLRARLGLNTGPVIIGNMGSRTRFSYTMMGDNVNLAARMESGAKLLGVYTMATEFTRYECEKHGGDRVVFRYLDRILVQGKTQPVSVQEVVGLKSELDQQTWDCLGLHRQGIEHYLGRDWEGAQGFFEQSAKLERFQPSAEAAIENNPSLIMIERCKHLKAHPPGDDWDGVWAMTEKG
ncbi:MAG TPA: adenylate/guanylate cyclase domain-containing protein, partial [Candidatus Didemnitutus sp.]|nr:adenylate/guanylate cyclase domain-containing protein [Candidatus Didemnitutus sp.]